MAPRPSHRRLLPILVPVALALGVVGGYLLPHRSSPGPARLGAPGPWANSLTFTLATYNVHNFFDRHDNPYTADESTSPKSARALDALAQGIQATDADVVVFQEVESGGFLGEFLHDRLPKAYPYVVDEPTGDPRGIGLAVASRFPVERITSHRLTPLEASDPGSHLSRDLLRVDLLVLPGRPFTVYGMHLKSRLDSPGDPGSAKRRLAEACLIRDLIHEQMAPSAAFALVGDANDLPGSPALQALRAATDPPLLDALGALPPAERITFQNAQYAEAIDHILLSPGLANSFDSAGIAPATLPFTAASDHRPAKVRVHVVP